MRTSFDEKMMARCIQLAKNGLGTTYPNPLVGCVIVHHQKIIGEGWHYKAGKQHAEVIAIESVLDKSLLKESCLYVSLEPCAHYGKTPPCTELIIQSGIPKVLIGITDSFAKVNGQGIDKLKKEGIEVIVGLLKDECNLLNKRFFTFHQQKRPYIVLKWAQTINGFMASENEKQKWISNRFSKQLVHLWRTEEQAILVGTNTAKIDNPQLNAREWNEQSPIRIVLDKDLSLPTDLNLFDKTQPTIVFTEKEKENTNNIQFLSLNFDDKLEENILKSLFQLDIHSVIIEGGVKTLNRFIEKNLWDEARILIGSHSWENGIKAPFIENHHKTKLMQLDEDEVLLVRNDKQILRY